MRAELQKFEMRTNSSKQHLLRKICRKNKGVPKKYISDNLFLIYHNDIYSKESCESDLSNCKNSLLSRNDKDIKFFLTKNRYPLNFIEILSRSSFFINGVLDFKFLQNDLLPSLIHVNGGLDPQTAEEQINCNFTRKFIQFMGGWLRRLLKSCGLLYSTLVLSYFTESQILTSDPYLLNRVAAFVSTAITKYVSKIEEGKNFLKATFEIRKNLEDHPFNVQKNTFLNNFYFDLFKKVPIRTFHNIWYLIKKIKRCPLVKSVCFLRYHKNLNPLFNSKKNGERDPALGHCNQTVETPSNGVISLVLRGGSSLLTEKSKLLISDDDF